MGKEIKLVATLYSPAKDRGGLNERKQKREKRGGRVECGETNVRYLDPDQNDLEPTDKAITDDRWKYIDQIKSTHSMQSHFLQ